MSYLRDGQRIAKKSLIRTNCHFFHNASQIKSMISASLYYCTDNRCRCTDEDCLFDLGSGLIDRSALANDIIPSLGRRLENHFIFFLWSSFRVDFPILVGNRVRIKEGPLFDLSKHCNYSNTDTQRSQKFPQSNPQVCHCSFALGGERSNAISVPRDIVARGIMGSCATPAPVNKMVPFPLFFISSTTCVN